MTIKIFYPIFFLAITNKLIEHEFGKKARYCSEAMVCILFMIYAVRHDAYIINGAYSIILLILDFGVVPLLIRLIKKFVDSSDIGALQVGEKKGILCLLSIVDLSFIFLVNVKIHGHFFVTEQAVKNSLLIKYMSADNFRYAYNILILMLSIYIVKSFLKFLVN